MTYEGHISEVEHTAQRKIFLTLQAFLSTIIEFPQDCLFAPVSLYIISSKNTRFPWKQQQPKP